MVNVQQEQIKPKVFKTDRKDKARNRSTKPNNQEQT
jgi:hypothetical protein